MILAEISCLFARKSGEAKWPSLPVARLAFLFLNWVR